MQVSDVKINCITVAASGVGTDLSYESSCADRDMTHTVQCSSGMIISDLTNNSS